MNPKGRASSPLRADGCNHAFRQRKERRARSDAPELAQPVHSLDARPMLELGSFPKEPRRSKGSLGDLQTNV